MLFLLFNVLTLFRFDQSVVGNGSLFKSQQFPEYSVRFNKTMASNEVVLVENAVSKLFFLQLIAMRISTLLNELFQLVQFYLKPSKYSMIFNSYKRA